MTLAQVQAGVAIVMALILSWSALLTAVAISLPEQANRADRLLESEPRRCFFRGLGMLAIMVLAVILLSSPAPLLKLIGVLLLLFVGAVVSVGAAGLAHLMGKRIGEMSGARSSFGALVRGSLTYSVAMLFPLIGWYLFLPISTVFALGAGISAIWPKRRTVPTSPLSAFEGTGVA